MMLFMLLLVAVLAAHPCFGARIPDKNVKSLDAIGSHAIWTQTSTHVDANVMTDKARLNKVAPAPPSKATFIAECYVSPNMAGLCWVGESTGLMLDPHNGGRIIKFDVDLKLGFCISSVLYAKVPGWRLSCASNGEIYISDINNKVVRIIKAGHVTEWEPSNVPYNAPWGGMAINDRLIALDFQKKPVNLYNRERKFLYNVSSEADNYKDKYQLSLSPSSSHLVTTATYNDYIFVHDLVNNRTIKVGGKGTEEGKLRWPWSTSFDASEKYILVSEQLNDRISVFGVDGSFARVLEMGPGGSDKRIHFHHATIHGAGKPSLLAVQMSGGGSDNGYIKIYSLST